MAPVVIDNHVLVGTGNDLDMPGFLQSFDPETGKLQWKFGTRADEARRSGPRYVEEPRCRAITAAVIRGCPASYDPETRPLHLRHRQSDAGVYAAPAARATTCSRARWSPINVDTGKMAWYYQTSPHDTHDWDSAQTPVLVDGEIDGRPRKLVLTAARNGYFFTVDRVTGEHLLTSKFSESANWARPELNAKGQPIRIPAKDHHIAGALVSSANQGAANWPPPSYSPQTGLFYVPTTETYALYYLTEPDPRGALGLGGKDERSVGTAGSYLTAIDYKTGKIVWKRRYRTTANTGLTAGFLTTAGRLLFAGDVGGNFVAYDPANGTPLWHTQLGPTPPTHRRLTWWMASSTCWLRRGDTLYAFSLLLTVH